MAEQQQIDPGTQNLMARNLLLATGIKMTKRLQPIKAALMGSQVQVPLLRMGIMTGITLHFAVNMGAVDADAVVSPFFPHNFVQNVMYTDFAGVNRTKTNGWSLWAAQGYKAGEVLGSTAYQHNPGAAGFGYGYQNSNILTRPDSVEAKPAVAGKVFFSLYIPLAYDPSSDLTGAVLTQTNVGEHYVTINFANALIGDDSYAFPYQEGPAVLGAAGIEVEAFQHYIQPQSLNAAQLPLIDLSTVYGFEGGYQAMANIAAGQSTYINYPNNRSILSTLISFDNGGQGTPNETDVSQVTLLANSNTNFWELSPRLMREQQRFTADGDQPSGVYYFAHRRQPILTQLYANVQAKFDVTEVAADGPVQFVSQYEVQYPSGAPLPGITA